MTFILLHRWIISEILYTALMINICHWGVKLAGETGLAIMFNCSAGSRPYVLPFV